MLVVLYVCDQCRRESPPNTARQIVERLGWQIRKKDDPPTKRDLCPRCR